LFAAQIASDVVAAVSIYTTAHVSCDISVAPVHWSELGHQWAADAIAKYLLANRKLI
jgi:hypothetical protein